MQKPIPPREPSSSRPPLCHLKSHERGTRDETCQTHHNFAPPVSRCGGKLARGLMRRWFLGSMRLVSRPRAVLARPFTARARRQYSATGQRVVPVKRRLPRRWGASLARGWFRRGPARRRGASLARSMSGPAVGAQDEVEREKFLREFQNRVDVDPGLAQYVAAGISKDTGQCTRPRLARAAR